MLYKGIDRVESYYQSDVDSDLNKYVYVGGDAYNYIINSNMLTAHFVLSGASFVCGTLLIATGAIIRAIKKNKEQQEISQVA